MALLTLIQNEDAWQLYTRQFIRENSTVSNAEWTQPAQYPCLVTSLLVSNRIATCYVYVHDAKRLLEAAMSIIKAESERPKPKTEIDAYELPTGTAVVAQADFNRQVEESLRRVNENLLAIVDVLLGVRATKEDGYEKLVAKYSAFIDQIHAAGKDAQARLIHDSPASRLVLRPQLPEDES